MANKLDPRIEIIRERYGLDAADFWELPQKKGTWVAKHAALEVAAVKAGIVFDMPVIVEKDASALITSMIVQGVMGDRTEWATGETNPSNYHVTGKQPSYPWAMAEKRAKDRVILKLIGIHGLVYSEDEMSTADERPEPAEPKQLVKVSREAEKQMRGEVDSCANVEELERLWLSPLFKEEFKRLHKTYQDGMLDLFRERKAFLSANPLPGRVEPDFSQMERVE